MGHRRSIMLLPAVGTATVLLVATPAAAAATWTVTPTQAVGSGSALADVDLVSATDGWAVGSVFGTGGLVERWNGTRWAAVPIPNLLQPGGSSASLGAVDALSASSAFAGGTTKRVESHGLEHSTAVALRCNGTAWSRMTIPGSTAVDNSVAGIKAFSASDVWAVGHTVPSFDGFTLAMHWNGGAWSVVPTPSPSTRDNLLLAVDGVAANDVWAVGYYRDPPYGNRAQHSLALHWNGARWSRVASPDVGTLQTRLVDLVAISASNVWAVGTTNVNTVGANDSSAVLRWNGSAWTRVTPLALASLWAVTALSATDIWVSGKAADGTEMLATWRGSGWTLTPAPGGSGTAVPTLTGIAALAPATVCVVGQRSNSATGATTPFAIRTTNG